MTLVIQPAVTPRCLLQFADACYDSPRWIATRREEQALLQVPSDRRFHRQRRRRGARHRLPLRPRHRRRPRAPRQSPGPEHCRGAPASSCAISMGEPRASCKGGAHVTYCWSSCSGELFISSAMARLAAATCPLKCPNGPRPCCDRIRASVAAHCSHSKSARAGADHGGRHGVLTLRTAAESRFRK